MFGKRKPPGSGNPGPGGEEPRLQAEGESRAPAGAPPTRGRPSYEVTRRSFDSLAPRRSEARAEPEPAMGGGRKLVVGQGIRLSGEIKKCETLVVEGHIEADLNDCASLEINQNGEYIGSAVVEAADISGRFEGALTVKGRLLLRSSGELRGTIRYADLEIERGGRIAGDVDIIAAPARAAGQAAEPAAASAAASATGGTPEQAEPPGDPALESAEAEPRQAAGGDKPGGAL